MDLNNILPDKAKDKPTNIYLQDNPINISEEEIIKWKNILLGDTTCFIQDLDFQCKKTEKSFSDHKTIYFDSERTRVLQTKAYPSFKSDLINILTYYCIQNNISYKQGLNEILAPFLILHCQYPSKLTKVEVYQMFKEFVHIYIINFLVEKQFHSFRHSLQFFQILFRYHNPTLYVFFEKMSVIPEMYALSWLLTLFSAKVRIDIVFHLWSYFIPIKDPLFPYYLLIALFIEKTSELIQEDNIKVISMLCSITIHSVEQLETLIAKANQLKEDTPYSFKLMIDSLGMFDYNKSTKSKEIENIPLMPTLAYEVCHLTRPDIFKCPNTQCPNITKYNNLNQITNKSKIDCWICNDKSKKDIYDSYIILDIRDSRQLDSCGLIPKSIFIKEELLNDKENNQTSISQMLEKEKGKYKFIILLSKTSYIDSFEKEENNKNILTTATSYKATILGRSTIDPKLKVEPRSNRLNPLFHSHPKKVKEFVKFKKLVNLLINKNEFPYVSYCYGGFEEMHKLFLQYNIPIVLHTYSQCLLCNKSRPKMKMGKSLSMQKNRFAKDIFGDNKAAKHSIGSNDKSKSNKVTMNEISDIISSNKNQVYFGILIKYQEENQNMNAQLFICLNEKECIIYQKEIKSGNCDSFVLLDTVSIHQIIFAKRDPNSKNILQLIIAKTNADGVINQSSDKNNVSLLIDFTNKEECRRFLVDLKEYGNLKPGKNDNK